MPPIVFRQNPMKPFLSIVSNGVPRLSNEAASIYRICLGFALLYAFHRRLTPIDNSTLVTIPRGYGLGSFAYLHWLSVNLSVQQYLFQIAKFALYLFILGVLPSISFTVAALCALQIVGVQLTRAGQHVWGAPMVVLLGLCFATWGDRYGIAQFFYRRRCHETNGQRPSLGGYGFAVWWPSLVIGVAYLCAAIAKLRLSGFEWITGGAVKYHFVEDFQGAPVNWGLMIADWPTLAVLLSLGAVLAEGSFILVNLTARPMIRLAFGLVGLSLHFGFWLFQGVVWIPWLVLYVCFLPWEQIHAAGLRCKRALPRMLGAITPAPPQVYPAPSLKPAHWIAVATLLSAQTYACYHRFEFEPFVSDYPMYSNTSHSWEEFIQERLWTRFQRYHFEVVQPNGTAVDVTPAMERMGEQTSNVLVDTFRKRAQTGTTAELPPVEELHKIRDAIANIVGNEVNEIRMTVDRRVLDLGDGIVDWQILDVPAGTLNLETGQVDHLNTAFLNDVHGILR